MASYRRIKTMSFLSPTIIEAPLTQQENTTRQTQAMGIGIQLLAQEKQSIPINILFLVLTPWSM